MPTLVSTLRRPLLWLTILASGVLQAAASAQNMRVFTTVSDVSQEDRPQTISHSLTLFHAGKVYDYMEESGEVVIFEPAHHRFIILNAKYIATEVPFAEVNHALEAAREEAVAYLQKLNGRQDPNAQRLRALIQFQISPNLIETDDPAAQKIKLTSDHLTYQVRTAEIESRQFVRQYLDYADWAARLNFVLHPNSTYPEARLRLNHALRQRDALPTQVDLQLQMSDPVTLRAEHQFAWEFHSADRGHISEWERLLQSDLVRWVPFSQYQQQVVAQQAR